MMECDKNLRNSCRFTKIDEKKRARRNCFTLEYDTKKSVKENAADMVKSLHFDGNTDYTLCMERVLTSQGDYGEAFVDLACFKQKNVPQHLDSLGKYHLVPCSIIQRPSNPE